MFCSSSKYLTNNVLLKFVHIIFKEKQFGHEINIKRRRRIHCGKDTHVQLFVSQEFNEMFRDKKYATNSFGRYNFKFTINNTLHGL